MKHLLCIGLTLSLVLVGCSNTATNEEEPIDENIEDTEEIEVDVEADENEVSTGAENDLVERDSLTESIDAGEEASGATPLTTDSSNVAEEEPIEEFVDGKLTEEGAIKKVKEYLHIESNDNVNIVVDHQKDGKYIVQVFDVMGNDVGHTMTRGWYTVDIETGEVEEMV